MTEPTTGALSGAQPASGLTDALSALESSLDELRARRPELVAEAEAKRAAGAPPSEILALIRDALSTEQEEA